MVGYMQMAFTYHKQQRLFFRSFSAACLFSLTIVTSVLDTCHFSTAFMIRSFRVRILILRAVWSIFPKWNKELPPQMISL